MRSNYMRIKSLLLLSAAFLLIGCSNNEESTTSSKEESLSTSSESESSVDSSTEESSEEESSEETTSESSEEESSEESTSESSEEESSEEESTSESSEEELTNTLDVTFLNNENFTTGGLDNANVANAFVEAFNGDTDLLLTATATGTNLVQITNNDSEVCYINRTLQLGSRNSNGVLSLSFNYKVTKVEAVVQGYWTAYQYSGIPVTYSVDEYANICIGDDDNYVDLSSDGEGEPEQVTVSFEFNGVYSLDLYNLMNAEELPNKQGQRSYIHSLSITYIE